MSAASKQVIDAALELEPDERAEVVRKLLDSLDGQTNGGLDAAWLEELERRAKDIDESREQLISWPEARREIEEDLRRSRER